MAEALEAACGVAVAGNTVLLSPACASFDEFSGFDERGRVFKALVAERIAAAEAAR
jgi:UDP-N-acetylmuramoylalanine--D-glutamate ligase